MTEEIVYLTDSALATVQAASRKRNMRFLEETFEFTYKGEYRKWYINLAWHFIVWNISQADMGILLPDARIEVTLFKVAEANITLEDVERMAPELNKDYAMTTDMELPLLCVDFHGEPLVIDGWHRLYRALKEGIDLPIINLDKEREELILLESKIL